MSDYKWEVGQEVAHWWYRRFNHIAKVTRVTPTGMCRIEGSSELWGRDGYECSRSHRYNAFIRPYDDEAKKRIAEELAEREITRRANAIAAYLWRNAEPDLIEKAYALIAPTKEAPDER